MIQWRWIVYNQQDADALQTLGGMVRRVDALPSDPPMWLVALPVSLEAPRPKEKRMSKHKTRDEQAGDEAVRRWRERAAKEGLIPEDEVEDTVRIVRTNIWGKVIRKEKRG